MTINATSIERVKAWDGTPTNTAWTSEQQAQINQLIPAVSRAIEAPGLLNRALTAEERTEQHRLRGYRTRSINLRHGPVDDGEDFTLKVDRLGDWANATTLVAGTDFVLDALPAIVRFDVPRPGPSYAQVTYTAGLAADLDALAAAYPDIVQAATLWVYEIHKRRNQLTATADAVGGNGAVTYSKALQHPPEAVKGLLLPHRWGTTGA